MATKRQQEIREWCLSNLEADEKLLWYGEAEVGKLEQVAAKISQLFGSFTGKVFYLLILTILVVLGSLGLTVVAVGLILIGVAGFRILPVLVFIAIPASTVLIVTGAILICLVVAEWRALFAHRKIKATERFQKVVYMITNYRILSFGQKPYGEFPLEQLDEAILSKPKDSLSNISLYPITKSKNPQPSHVLRAIPEEEAQDAYLILREARDYAERVHERDAALNIKRKNY